MLTSNPKKIKTLVNLRYSLLIMIFIELSMKLMNLRKDVQHVNK